MNTPLQRIAVHPVKVPYTREALAKFISLPGWDIGEYSYGVPSVFWWGEPVRLVIGKFCSIADKVSLFLGTNHRTDWATTYPFSHINTWSEAHTIQGHPTSRGDIIIGHDVWLGSGCSVLSGITIGNGAVVGAHCVVSRDVEPYTIVVGNPAVVVRKRFSEKEIAMLQEIQWWNWSEANIRSSVKELCSPNIHALYALWKKRTRA